MFDRSAFASCTRSPVLVAGVIVAMLAAIGSTRAFAAERPATGAGETARSAAADYRLGAGDRVRVMVFDNPDLSGEYHVDGSGQMAFPLIGSVSGSGLTASQLAQALVRKLHPDYLVDPKISIEVLTYRPFYIVGEVRRPGSYPYVSGMTILNAVALAGGFTYRAREEDFYITREASGKKGRHDAGPATTVQPGDVITVRERFF